MPIHRSSGATRLVSLLAVGGIVALALSASRQYRSSRSHRPDSGPGYTARQSRFGDYAVSGNTVTIDRPRHELFSYWRDLSNLARFMENVRDIRPTGERTAVWTINGPLGRTVELETEIVAERFDKMIAWRSVDGSEIDAEGKVIFKDAPAGRGTVVEAIIAYHPPAGELGRWVATAFGREPKIQGRRELRRFKMLTETGEIANADHYRKGD